VATLTPEQLAKLMEIIRDASSAIAVQTMGHKLHKDEIERLRKEGYLSGESKDLVLDSFVFGQTMQREQDSQQMSFKEFETKVDPNPSSLSGAEKSAYEAASRRAGMYTAGLGNRYSDELSMAVVVADQELATKRGKESPKDVKQAQKQLELNLGSLVGAWKKDWENIATTESHLAHQEGVLTEISERYGDDELLAKLVEPDACEYCRKHYIGSNGQPLIKPASWWHEQGPTNVGRKPPAWKPVLGAMHPHCRCQLIRVPAGWGFDDKGDLVPLEKSSFAGSAAVLEKARKLHDRMSFQGFDISIENRAGSVRKWTDEATGTEGETKMLFPYGYIRRTEGTDLEQVDVFVGPNEAAKRVFIIHQMKAPTFKEHDEDKCMLGFSTKAAAKKAYLGHFDRSEFLGSITTMPVDEFRKKVYRKKGEIIKAHSSNGQLELSLMLEPIDELVLWEKACAHVGIKTDQLGLIVKYARLGHPDARKTLDVVQEFVKSFGTQTYGSESFNTPVTPTPSRGFPIQHGSYRPETVSTMGQRDQPARTAGDNVRSHRVGKPRDDWPPERKTKKRRVRKRRNIPCAAEKLDVVGLTPGKAGWAHEYKPEKVVRHVEAKPQKKVLESLEMQQQSRQKLRQGSKLNDLDIHQ